MQPPSLLFLHPWFLEPKTFLQTSLYFGMKPLPPLAFLQHNSQSLKRLLKLHRWNKGQYLLLYKNSQFCRVAKVYCLFHSVRLGGSGRMLLSMERVRALAKAMRKEGALWCGLVKGHTSKYSSAALRNNFQTLSSFAVARRSSERGPCKLNSPAFISWMVPAKVVILRTWPDLTFVTPQRVPSFQWLDWMSFAMCPWWEWVTHRAHTVCPEFECSFGLWDAGVWHSWCWVRTLSCSSLSPVITRGEGILRWAVLLNSNG